MRVEVGAGLQLDRAADPAVHDLGVDAHREHVVPALLDVLAPVKLGLAGCQARGEHAEPHLLGGADNALQAQQAPHRDLAGNAERRRADRRDKLGVPVGGGDHRPRLGQVARHARLAKHMLAGLERRDGDSRVHIRRGADPNDIDLRVVNDLAPVVAHARDAEFRRESLRRFAAPVADGDDFNTWNRPQPRHVPLAHDPAGAHDSNSHYV